ncbi:hypothetical protein LWI29_015132 [Acer saccharum]|uniref:Uncharacterized protein n=1 Tax=Acer saccharum TaxID=4024 RepID=A0AA39RQ48_ACESA|nr:hypothetical protein LWI29_015132 [Acer saccharum]
MSNNFKRAVDFYGIAAKNDEGSELHEVVVDELIDHVAEEETRKREEEETSKRERQLELYRAAVEGDWGVAERIFKSHPEDIKSIISMQGDTVLHIATAASHTRFVEQLAENYNINLFAKNFQGNTALCLAATTGKTKLIELMMKKGNNIAEIGAMNKLPVQIAAMYGHENTRILCRMRRCCC